MAITWSPMSTKGHYYMNRFIDKLKAQGLDANYIDNKNNGLKYVYLQRYDTWDEALAAYSQALMGNTRASSGL